MKHTWQVIVASTLIVTQGAMAGTAFTGEVPLKRTVDPITGAEVRIYQTDRPGRDARIEIQDRSVLIRKELTNGTLLTTIVAGGERVSLAVNRTGLVVTNGNDRVIVQPDRPDRAEAARNLVAKSAAIRRATTLMGRLADGPDSPVRHTARATRAMLLSAAGDATGVRELSKWARAARETIGVKAVSIEEDQGPGQCWQLYAIEAIRIYIEYEECMYETNWYDLVGMISCAFLYDLQAIGAFSWWITCVGLRGGVV
ncbi:MAG TPA: hypothetical protein VF424_06935 [Vicinamibacterales bacterium]